MELRKRSLTEKLGIDNSNYKSKKPKKDLSKRKSQIEDFPGEFWFELFAYFDGQSLIDTFSQLNSYIQSLLSDYRLPIHLNIFSTNFIVPSTLNSNQIVSLNIDYSLIDNNPIIDVDRFVRLRSLRLMYINDQQLEQTSQLSLHSLRQISIRSKCAKFLTKIISTYFPNVKQMTLDSMQKEFVVKSFRHDNTRSRIEKLTLCGKIKLVKLFRLWPFIPNLRSLSIINEGVHECDYWVDEHIISRQNFPPHLSFMHIEIYDDGMSFSNLERLIPKSIRYLIISGSIADDDLFDYLSSENWIRLISNCSNKLDRIKINITSYFDSGDFSGLQKVLSKFRKNHFFRNVIIQSKSFFITVEGFIQCRVYE